MKWLRYTPSILVLALVLLIEGFAVRSASAQDLPDPNPRRNPDGTFTWWVGNNTQFPIIQAVLDAALPGDEVVVMPGQYVEDLLIETGDLSLRPACMDASGQAVWGELVLWNPTEGFEDDPWCVRVIGGNNTYIGRPRQFTQLANGYQTAMLVDPGEWDPTMPPVSIQQVTEQSGGVALTFWSRDTSSVAIYISDGAPSFQACVITSHSGFGSGLLVRGGQSSPVFVDCSFSDLYSSGEFIDGVEMSPILILEEPGDEETNISVLASFRNCTVTNCSAGSAGIIRQVGGYTSWTDCEFEQMIAPTADGIYQTIGGPVTFSRCRFFECMARMGTLWIDATTGLDTTHPVLLDRCDFIDNQTVDGQWGGILRAVGTESAHPPIELSGCGIDGNNGHSGFSFFDIVTPFFPYYRIGNDLINGPVLGPAPPCTADINGDGLVNGADLAILLGQWAP